MKVRTTLKYLWLFKVVLFLFLLYVLHWNNSIYINKKIINIKFVYKCIKFLEIQIIIVQPINRVSKEVIQPMKATGIVRRIDDLGRVVIPKELRRTLVINEGDPLEIYTEGELIILKKYEPSCIFCGEANEVINYKGKNICKHCMDKLREK